MTEDGIGELIEKISPDGKWVVLRGRVYILMCSHCGNGVNNLDFKAARFCNTCEVVTCKWCFVNHHHRTWLGRGH